MDKQFSLSGPAVPNNLEARGEEEGWMSNPANSGGARSPMSWSLQKCPNHLAIMQEARPTATVCFELRFLLLQYVKNTWRGPLLSDLGMGILGLDVMIFYISNLYH